MKISNYLTICFLLLINSIFAASLGGRVIIDGRDPYFKFNGQLIVITDASNTFGSVVMSSTGNFTLPNTVTDNKPHGYSITIKQGPDNNSFICSISDNQVTGMVYLKDKTDLTIACRGQYHSNISVTGLTPQDSLTATDYQNETLTFTSTSDPTQTFSNWFYSNYINYSLNSIKYNFTYAETNYRRCVSQNKGVTNNYFNISVNCFDSSFSSVTVAVPSGRSGIVGWTDSSGNYYLFGGNDGAGYKQDLWMLIGSGSGSWVELKPSTITQPWPTGRSSSVAWTDSSGNKYLFGGNGGSIKQDLWKLTVSGNTATWINLTPTTITQPWPSARYSGVAWTDSSDNKYLFGGVDSNNTLYNDLWKLTVSGNTATWVNLIPETITQPWPTARKEGVAWTDKDGNKYLFGGFDGSYKTDLWKLTVSGNTATWVLFTIRSPWPLPRKEGVAWADKDGNNYLFGGSFVSGFNTQELWKLTVSGNTATWFNLTPADTSTVPWPSAIKNSVTWTDKDGNSYLFGGNDNINNFFFNNLWKISVSDTSPTWTKINPAKPGLRYGSVGWTDNSGNKYLFGGGSIRNTFYQDLWKLIVSGNTATWVNLTPADTSTIPWPTARKESVGWTDNSGNYYLFGGLKVEYIHNTLVNTFYQDLWKLNVSGNIVTWVNLTPATPITVPWPSGRTSSVGWTDNSGNYYLFGGLDSISLGFQKDLWKLNVSGNIVTWVNLTPADTSTVPWPSARGGSANWKDKDGKIYLFGGDGGAFNLNDLFML